MAERVGYSPSRLAHPTIFSVACVAPVWILAISTISPLSTASSISIVWANFRPTTDTKDTKARVEPSCRYNVVRSVLHMSGLAG